MYDLLIIGGGPAGYLAAERAGHEKLSAAVFERRAFGGVCLNEGCIPSKTLLNSAKIYDYATGYGKKYGVSCDNPVLDYKAVIARKNKVVKTLISGIEAALKAGKVEMVRESAAVTGSLPSGGFTVSAGGKTYEGKNLLLCTGSEPILPPIDGLKEAMASGFGMTNREMLDMDVLPASMVVVGGGVIGLEMASVMLSAGVKVTVVEMLDRIANPTDREIAGILQKNYEKKGMTFILGAKVTKIEKDGVTFEKDGGTHSVPCEKVLFSIGRRASTAGLGLENINVLTDRGAVVTDEQMKTNVPGVFAAGDINGKSLLAHTAYREAEVAVNILCEKKDRMEYNAIPSVIYTNPEVAGAGETAESAAAKGIDVREVKLPMIYSGRYLAENEGCDGIAKLVLEKGTDRLIGVHMIGNPCSEIIVAAAMAIEREMPLEALKKVVFPHPTVAEIIREAVFMA